MVKELLRIISIWIIILPLVAGFINYKGLNRDSKWIFSLVLVALVPQIFTFIINKETPLLNACYNIYTVAEFVLLYFLFSNKYNHKSYRIILQITVAFYTIAATVLIFRLGVVDKFLNDLVCINHFFFMIWILLFLKEQYSLPDSIIHKQNPFAWYLLAWLIYAPCSILAFALYYYIREKENPVLLNLWIIQSVCNILLYIFFSVGLFLSKQKTPF